MKRGCFNKIVLQAIGDLGGDAYGTSILNEVARITDRFVSVGAIYAALNRLEEKGLVRSRLGESTPQRGGKRKRYYEIVDTGGGDAT